MNTQSLSIYKYTHTYMTSAHNLFLTWMISFCVCVWVCLYVYIYTHTHTQTSTHTQIYIHTHIYIYMHVFIYIYIYIHIIHTTHTHTHTCLRRGCRRRCVSPWCSCGCYLSQSRSHQGWHVQRERLVTDFAISIRTSVALKMQSACPTRWSGKTNTRMTIK